MAKNKKKRLPIEQLREVAKESERILRDKGIHTKESAIDQIINEKKLSLPGIPAYLPHRWTIATARKIMADLVIIWLAETKGKPSKQEDHREFFRFIVREMEKIEKRKKKENEMMPSLIKQMSTSVTLNTVFAPMQAMETAHTMNQFLMDSFAVAVILKQHNTVTDYVLWFDEWTRDMETYWNPKEQRND